ncbi:MAG TPA: glycoside hydrolase family 30 beta sandwich domain-containing protein [Anaerolineales bacterium]|nr:glycoside hydrolase family 30 beta sandwich domain-containing protein [Anaerolineales bacterium]
MIQKIKELVTVISSIILITGCAGILAAPAEDIPVNVWLTTSDQSMLLEPQTPIAFSTDPVTDGKVIYVNEDHYYQQMDGFGASMTDSSAWLIYTQLNESQRTNVMEALFSPENGIGVSITRIPMGASDFVNGKAYTYDDMPPGQTDPELAHFSIDHDRAYIIPALQDALKINPDLKIMASPWSPPAWMKTSDELGHGSLLPEYYEAYANYFVKFIQAYEAENVPVYAITLQNEPHHEPQSYPGMRMEPEEAAVFVKQFLGPAFEAAGIESKILIWDHNWDEYDYPIAVLDDADAKTFVDGIAFHCYGGTVIAQGLVHDAHPDVDIYFTECSGGAWIPSFAEGIKRDIKDLVMGSTRNWAKTVIKWNLALDTSYGPHNGGCGNCFGFITIDPEIETGFTTNWDYYSIGHLSKFVRNGAYRIASTSFQYEGLESVAFQNPDGSKAMVISNTSSTEKTFILRWGSQGLSYSLPSGTVATFTWDGEQQTAAIPTPPTGIKAKFADDKIILNWEFSPLAESYTIKRSDTPGGPDTVIASDVDIPEYFDLEIDAGSTYYYVVSAVNVFGESSDSAEANAVP